MLSRSQAVLGLIAVGLFGCGRASSTQSAPVSARAEPAPSAEWTVPCEKLCGVSARAASLDALAIEVRARVVPVLGPSTRCEARAPLGLGLDPSFAIKDAAILDVTSSTEGTSRPRYALLALQTELGWVVARELGTVDDAAGGHVGVLEGKPVDVVGLEPASLEVRVALGHAGEVSERLFVCGLTGEGAVECPLALEAGKHAEPQGQTSPFAAGLSGALPIEREEWQLEVELTADGFVAKKASGAPPTSVSALIGEHSWAEAARWR